MALSVWGRKTHEVLMVTYLILVIWLSSPLLVELLALAPGVPRPLSVPPAVLDVVNGTNPFMLVYAPYNTPGKIGMLTFMLFLLVCLCFSALLTALAAYRVRAVALRQAGQGSVARRRRWALRLSRPAWLPRLPGPSLDGNPVLWREWQRYKPSRFLRVAWVLYTAMGLTGFAVALTTGLPNSRMQAEVIVGMSVFQVAVGLLLLSVNASTGLAEERARGSIDVLLSTPLSTLSIVIGKWWGAFRLAPHVIFWPACLAAILLWNGGSWFGYILLLVLLLAYCVVIASLGLAVATWVSRLGRAVAICVTVVVGFAVGWMFLIMSMFSPDYKGIPLIMGSPLYGSAAATSIVSTASHIVGGEPRYKVAGAILWTCIHGSTAAFLLRLRW